ncbi:unnamed protein product [Phytophthora lilii]|uniref:Unnamed protein product n=1 Tax=Phytophthora lilii TaxID=2077276 RepID=A0A9W6TTX6_9STRA|nr:unnamed protein product [Phytophthora lilii]
MAAKSLKIMFLGAPGAGKGTYASRIAPMLQIPTISTGDLVRHEIKSGTPLGAKIKVGGWACKRSGVPVLNDCLRRFARASAGVQQHRRARARPDHPGHDGEATGAGRRQAGLHPRRLPAQCAAGRSFPEGDEARPGGEHRLAAVDFDGQDQWQTVSSRHLKESGD